MDGQSALKEEVLGELLHEGGVAGANPSRVLDPDVATFVRLHSPTVTPDPPPGKHPHRRYGTDLLTLAPRLAGCPPERATVPDGVAVKLQGPKTGSNLAGSKPADSRNRVHPRATAGR